MTITSAKVRTQEFIKHTTRFSASILLLVLPLSSHAITRSEFDALGAPQYLFNLSRAECTFAAADTCTSYRDVAGTSVLQGKYKDGIIFMENSENLSKQKLGIVTLTLEGAFPNEQPLGIKFTPTWTAGEPSGSGAGYYNGYEHPSPNTFEISFKILPQPKSESIDLNNLSFKDWAGVNWKLADHWGYLTSVKVETNCVPVPEPETYAMLLAGLGLVGAFARRRKVNLTA